MSVRTLALLGALFVTGATANAGPGPDNIVCQGRFRDSQIRVTTESINGQTPETTLRMSWTIPGYPLLRVLVAPPTQEHRLGFAYGQFQGYVDQQTETARVSTPAGMEEIKLDCRRDSYAKPQAPPQAILE